MTKLKDYVGLTFNKWTVIDNGYFCEKANSRIVIAKCLCGKEKNVNFNSIRRGISKSCINCRKPTIKHGLTKTGTWYSWIGMIERCSSEKHQMWYRYGGRGIKVDERWIGKHGFENFLSDMGIRPEGLEIDRIDNDGNYEPSNCRWVTHLENVRNREHWAKRLNGKPYPTSKPIISIDKNNLEKKHNSLADASRELGVSMGAISSMLSGKYKAVKGYRFEFII